MIYQFVYLDFGAKNLLNLIRYSALNIRAAIQKDHTNDQIWLNYVRSIGRNPNYDIAALKEGGIFDKLELTSFGNNPEDITMAGSWYHKRHAAYLQMACKTDEPICYVHNNISFHYMPTIDESKVYFWGPDHQWYDVAWGFLKKDDARQFIEYCQEFELLSSEKSVDDIISDPFYNADILYIPKQHIEEVQRRYYPMMQWILDFYADYFADLYCACSIAGQLCLSLIICDMIPDEDVKFLADTNNFPFISRFGSEAEEDISGSLRLCFE